MEKNKKQNFNAVKADVKLRCQVCGEVWMGEPPKMCCDGRDCGCMGLPIDPILCSQECGEKLFGNVV